MPPKSKKVSPTFKALKIMDETMGSMTTAPPKYSPETNRGILESIAKDKVKRNELISQAVGMGGSDRPKGTLPVPRMPAALMLPRSTKPKEDTKTWATPSTKRVYKKKESDDMKIEEFKKGGLVKKTGIALVHKGEYVVPAHRVSSVEKAVKKAGLKPLKK